MTLAKRLRTRAEQSIEIAIRPAVLTDLESLCLLENNSFKGDKLSRRSLRHYIEFRQSELLIAEQLNQFGDKQLIGYGLVWLHRGTRLARLYSLAVSPTHRGQGIAQSLLKSLESAAAKRGRLYMRLEVSKNNQPAIKLYQSFGYQIFGEYCDYYQDHSDALRMQKVIRQVSADRLSRTTPWYQQSTEFTCGPAALMMAMASLDPNKSCNQTLELDLWREATTIFMTTGHGGCHPFGLALAAQHRGFQTKVVINNQSPLFIDGVRTNQKKAIMTLVHHQFETRCAETGVRIVYQELTIKQIENWLAEDLAVLLLISTYRLDGKKAPHWVLVTGLDDDCLYVHDPHRDEKHQRPIDCQHIPIARDDFSKLSTFGRSRLRTALAIKPPTAKKKRNSFD